MQSSGTDFTRNLLALEYERNPIHSLTVSCCPSHQWLEADGFLRLWALAGTNGAGIGTSALARYDRCLSALELGGEHGAEVRITAAQAEYENVGFGKREPYAWPAPIQHTARRGTR